MAHPIQSLVPLGTAATTENKFKLFFTGGAGATQTPLKVGLEASMINTKDHANK